MNKFKIDLIINQLLLDHPDKEFMKCRLCEKLMIKDNEIKTIVCKNGDWFCQNGCLENLIKEGKCKICNLPINNENQFSRDKFIESYINKMSCYCPYSFKLSNYIINHLNNNNNNNNNQIILDESDNNNNNYNHIELIKDIENGCNEIINFGELQKHFENCKFRFINCKNFINGCKEIKRFNEISNHLNGECQYENNCINKSTPTISPIPLIPSIPSISSFEPCKYKWCNEKIKIDELEDHESQCIYKEINCEFCKESIIKLYQSTHICNKEILFKIQYQQQQENQEKHQKPQSINEKQNQIIKCNKCNENIKMDELLNHFENECLNCTINCPYYDQGCFNTFKRSLLSKHIEEINHTYFMKLFIEKQTKQLNEFKETTNQYKKQLKESNIKCNKLLKQFNNNNNNNQNQFQPFLILSKEPSRKYSNIWKIPIQSINITSNEFIIFPYIFSIEIKLINNQFNLILSQKPNVKEFIKILKFKILLLNFKNELKNIMKFYELDNNNEDKNGEIILSNIIEIDKLKEDGYIDDKEELSIYFNLKILNK